MTTIFLDTSFIIALELVDEQYHQIAINYWQGLIQSSPQFVISSYVFDEIVTFLNSPGLTQNRTKVGVIHELPLRNNQGCSYILRKSYSRNRHDKAVEVRNRLINSSIIDIVQVDECLFFEGWEYFKQHNDKSYSLTDCISFLVMNRLNIQLVLTFDKHFSQAGYQKLPI